MKRFVLALLLSVLVPGLLASPFRFDAYGQNILTADQVNGTWETRNGTFKIWALGHQKLKIEFSGTFEYTSPAGPMANTGEGSGTALIQGDTATFRPEGAEDECAITLKFTRGKLVVTQDGICGFGNRVTAAGTYRKVNGSKPKFSQN